MTVFEQLILDRIDRLEKLLKDSLTLNPPIATTENDFTRAKRAALEDREKKLQRRQQRMARA
jgi:hypothetical protein